MKGILTVSCFLILLMSCSAELTTSAPPIDEETTDDPQISTSVLEGKVMGEPWVFYMGIIRKSVFDNGRYEYRLYNENVNNPCDQFSAGSEYKIFGNLPLKVGVLNLDLLNNMTFYHNNVNNVATQGKVIIKVIDDQSVSGAMLIKSDDNNQVNGEFELTRCD